MSIVKKSQDDQINNSDMEFLGTLYFSDENVLVRHQIDPYNEFIEKNIPLIIERYAIRSFITYPNPAATVVQKVKEFRHKITFSNLHIEEFPKTASIVHNVTPLFPNAARSSNSTYSSNLYVDIRHEIEVDGAITTIPKHMEFEYPRINIGPIPTMIRSSICSLDVIPRSIDRLVHEDFYDPGGYFIVKGHERVVVGQERQSDNHLYVFKEKKSSRYQYSCLIRSRNTIFESTRINKILIDKNNQLYIMLSPGLKEPLPIVVLFRALGFESDRDIIKLITWDLDDHLLIDKLRPSLSSRTFKITERIPIKSDIEGSDVEDETTKYTQKTHDVILRTVDDAYEYIANKTIAAQIDDKEKRFSQVTDLFDKFLLPHLPNNFEKGRFVAYMIRRVLLASIGIIKSDDRDSMSNKRIDDVGTLSSELFRWTFIAFGDKMHQIILRSIRKVSDFGNYDFNNLVDNAIKNIKIIETSFKTSLSMGDWTILKKKRGTDNIRKGVAQLLERKSYISMLSQLRRISIPTTSSGKAQQKNSERRRLHGSSYGFYCPVETPEGEKIGLLKNLSLAATVSSECDRFIILSKLDDIDVFIKYDEKVDPLHIGQYKLTTVIVSGHIVGVTPYPDRIVTLLREMRRKGEIDKDITILHDYWYNEIRIYTDAGRLLRPLLIVDRKNKLRLTTSHIQQIKNGNLTWKDLVYKGIIECVDSQEIEQNCYIAMTPTQVYAADPTLNEYTHCEIRPIFMVGVVVGLIPLANYDQGPRNLFQAAMGKQAIGIYAMNYRHRMDTLQYVLWSPERPIVTTKISPYLHYEALPAGQNLIVAIGCYTGYNMEDSLVFNQSAIDRGLMRATHYKTYQTSQTDGDDRFMKPTVKTSKVKSFASYEIIGDDGIAKEGSIVHHNTTLISKQKRLSRTAQEKGHVYKDESILYKEKLSGVIDKTICSTNEDGYSLHKVKVRSTRTPEIGDKFTSRHGQKGTIGIALPQHLMPFTKNGITPDIIISPQAIPSRMTIGQLLECMMGKLGAHHGRIVDGSPFCGITEKLVSNELVKAGYLAHGDEQLYDGFTGRPMRLRMFMGPTYYQRLPHLVSDKYHGRSRGPRALLSHQPVGGRAHGGGMRIGEMERDVMIAHGISLFQKERFMECSDGYKMFVCDLCGFWCIGNPLENRFKCVGCNNTSHISMVEIPYAFKLLMQEVYTMGIIMRILTENSKLVKDHKAKME
jgi:DNA-directed RNA polymerase II subunit RPB2